MDDGVDASERLTAQVRVAEPREVAERELDVDPVATEPARVPHQRPHGLSGVQEQGQQSLADRPCGPRQQDHRGESSGAT